MKMGANVQTLCSSEQHHTFDFSLREVGVGYIEHRVQGRIVSGINRSNGRDIGRGISIDVQSDGGGVVGDSVDEWCSGAVFMDDQRSGRGIGRQRGTLGRNIGKVAG